MPHKEKSKKAKARIHNTKKARKKFQKALITTEDLSVLTKHASSESTKDLPELKTGKKNKGENTTIKSVSTPFSAAANSQIDEYKIWEDLGVCADIIAALKDLGFQEPTAIQREAIPAALRDRQDILGSAETGSGKTLAFGIPVLQRILELKLKETPMEMDDDDDGDVSSTSELFDDPPDDNEQEFGWADSDIDGDLNLLSGELKVIQDGQIVDKHSIEFMPDDVLSEKNIRKKAKSSPLFCLILTPTRELAVQVASHLRKIALYTDVRVDVIYGGMSQQKQERLLSRCPEIVVGTPGRIWDLISIGEGHLNSAIDSLPMLVVDEADRMAEKGHFKELHNILELFTRNSEATRKRQHFLFSATLTFVHDIPQWGTKKLKKLRKMRQVTQDDKLHELAQFMHLHKKPKLIDVSRSIVGLTESLISCPSSHKDLYLYWFLRGHVGRVLIFCNSKDSVRRLLSVLSLLNCSCCLALHADMHQKHRLRNLERFQANSNSILLSTDVAARGLDIPNIDHVVQFQVPRVAETYVHRCGRTARALARGSAVALVAPEEASLMRRILNNLNRSELPNVEVNTSEISKLKPIVELARKVESLEHRAMRRHAKESWFHRAAQEMDLALSPEDLPEFLEHQEEDVVQKDNVKLTAGLKKMLESEKRRLRDLLRKLDEDKLTGGFPFACLSKKYPSQLAVLSTSQGKLPV